MRTRFAARVAEAGVSLSALSRNADVPRSLLTQYAGAKQVPSAMTAAKLARELGMEPHDLILDCLRDRWDEAAIAAPESLLPEDEKRPPVLRAINVLRQISLTRGVSDEFREKVEQAGELLLEAVAEEIAT